MNWLKLFLVCSFCFFFSPEDSVEQLTVIDAERMFSGVNNVLTAICPRLKDFHKILQDPPKVSILKYNLNPCY